MLPDALCSAKMSFSAPIGVFRNSLVSLILFDPLRASEGKKQDALAIGRRQDQNTIEQLMHQKFEIEQEYQAGASHQLDHGEKPKTHPVRVLKDARKVQQWG